MPTITRPGATIAWREQGEGSPLLLIMGTRFSSAMWYPVLPQLAAHHRVITFDNRGTGASSPSRDFTIADMVDDALAVLDAAGVERAHAYGVSLGGGLALELGMSHPDRVTSLVLGCTGAKTEAVPPPSRAALYASRLPFWLKARLLGKGLYGVDCDPVARKRDLAMLKRDPFDPESVLQQSAATCAYSTSLDRVAAVTAPTLVLHGDADPAVPVEGGRQLAETIPGAEIVVYPGAAHNYLVDHGDQSAHDVLDFLARVDTHTHPQLRQHEQHP